MLNYINFFHARLSKPLRSTDTVINLHAQDGVLRRLNSLPIGDHVYLAITYRSRVEVVRYTHESELTTAGAHIMIAVERGQHDTAAISFPFGTCVRTEITKQLLDEWCERCKERG